MTVRTLRICRQVIIVACCLTVALWVSASGGLCQTVNFWFIAPTATMLANFDEAIVFGVGTPGYRMVNINPNTVARFEGIGPPNILRTYRELQPGNDLRTRANQIYGLNGNAVEVHLYLVDDRTGMPDEDNPAVFPTVVVNGLHISWPCASVGPKSVSPGTYEGVIRLGGDGVRPHSDPSRRMAGVGGDRASREPTHAVCG